MFASHKLQSVNDQVWFGQPALLSLGKRLLLVGRLAEVFSSSNKWLRVETCFVNLRYSLRYVLSRNATSDIEFGDNNKILSYQHED
jgi:hypothetical protein